jgi:hypothetical protein
MFADCLSLSDSQYPVLLILLFLQVWLYKQHVVLQYGVVVTLFLLSVYPIFFDTLPRVSFGLFFSVVLLGYLIQMVYVTSKGVKQTIVPTVLLFVYVLLFFFISSTLNAALLFTSPIDAAVGLYKNAEGKVTVALKVYETAKR